MPSQMVYFINTKNNIKDCSKKRILGCEANKFFYNKKMIAFLKF